MKRNWKRYLKEVVAWTSLASAILPNTWGQAKASTELPTFPTKDDEPALGHINQSNPLPMTFTMPVKKGVNVLIAGHRSHRSHSSHRSHYSGSGGGYYTPSYSSSPSSSPSSTPYASPGYLSPNPSSPNKVKLRPGIDTSGDELEPIVPPSQLMNCTPDSQLKPSEQAIIIMKVQVELMHQGFYQGSVDGIIGSMTQEAVRCFQQHNNLTETSEIDEATLRKLKILK